jgi:hypothetical protein
MAKLAGMGLEVSRVGDLLVVEVTEVSKMRDILDTVMPVDFNVIEPTLEEAFLKLAI